MPTATIESTPPRISCAWKLSPYGPNVSTAPTPRESAIAPAMPIHSLRQHVGAADLVEVGDQDADDEARFEAFSQADQDVREHTGTFGIRERCERRAGS